MTYEPPTALPRDLLATPAMRKALEAHDFGTVFRLARTRGGISYSKIAAECDIKPERVGTLARGKGRVTSFDKVVAISDALRVPGHLLGLASRPWEVPAHGPSTTDAENRSDMRRRTFVRAASGLAAALPVRTTPGAQRLGPADVEALRARAARLRRLDAVLGGGDTYRVYLGEYQATKAMVRDAAYSEATGRGLLSVLAEQAQQAGWAAFDSGREADAVSLYKESSTAATEAGDADLFGNSLAFLAYQRVAGDRREATAIATRSCEAITAGTPTRVRALLHERMAWACAAAGLPRETERALLAAEEALDAGDDGPQPDWAAWVDGTELRIMAGRCWTELGRPLRAVPVLTAALAQYDDSHARDKALYLSWLADAYLCAGEPEEAATAVDRALDLASGVASVRPRRRLEPVLSRLATHRGLRPVSEVLARADV
ncbi:tetratricopeptide repeat protein [Streptomyces koyangensis]|uniref:Tetratricopeptide repeat protein n=1 Tax=Streptomyces koyangensis TaxID=188770 RepID=A0ABX7EHA6_9ACTN|nr:tetratricopeptide repeat protein [Streptomyces koyangensis]QRF03988.1 tetratricopeptide repeat protein [Streptomyces koyangensis]